MKIRMFWAALLLAFAAPVFSQTTPNINLNIPPHGAINWDVLMDQNFTLLDNYLGGVTQFPHALRTDITGSPTQLGGISFCTGFTPTNGQSLQLTTASSPNPCWTAASGGTGSMTWPSGSAGIPNYNGISAWGSTYNASNPIPANFLPIALQNGTTATTQTQADASTKIATTAYVDTGLGGKQASGTYVTPTTLNNGTLPVSATTVAAATTVSAPQHCIGSSCITAWPTGGASAGTISTGMGCQTLQVVNGSTLYQCENFSYWENNTTGALTWVVETGPISFGLPSAKYCVDSINGLDTNAGTCSPLAPYQTLAKLQTNTLTTTDTVALAANSHFRESLNPSVVIASVSAYGSGTRPLIDGSDPVLTSAMSLVSGTTYTYQVSWMHDPAISGGKYWGNVYENGTHLQWVTSAALVESTPGSFWITSFTGSVSGCDGSTPCVFYFHPVGSTNPITDGNLYEINRRAWPVTSVATTSGVWVRRNAHEDCMLCGGSFNHDVLMTDAADHAAMVQENSRYADVVLDGIYMPLYMSPFIWNFQPTCGTLEFNSVIITTPANEPGAASTGVGGFGGHNITNPCPFSSITYRGVKTWNNVSVFGGSLAASMKVIGSETHGAVRYGIEPDATYTTKITVDGLWAENFVSGAYLQVSSAAPTVSINGMNVSTANTGAAVQIAGGVASLSVQNSTFTGAQAISVYGGAIGSVNLQHNTFTAPNSGPMLSFASVPSSWASDYNTLYISSPGGHINNVWNGTNYADNWPGFVAASGGDAHSYLAFGANLTSAGGWLAFCYPSGGYGGSPTDYLGGSCSPYLPAGISDLRGSFCVPAYYGMTANATVTHTFNPYGPLGGLTTIPIIYFTRLDTNPLPFLPVASTTGVVWTVIGTPAGPGTYCVSYTITP